LALRDREFVSWQPETVAIFDLNSEDSAPFLSAFAQAIAIGLDCGFRRFSYTRSDRIRTAVPTFSYTW